MNAIRRSADFVLVVVGCVALALAVGGLLGAVSWYAWVIGLLGLVSGLTLGFCAVFFRTWLGLSRALTTWTAIAAIPVAFGGFLMRDDSNQLRAWREALAETRAAETGLPPDAVLRLVEAGGVDYLAQDAEARLDEELMRTVGATGAWGRFLARLDAGVRLGGSARHSRGLGVGRVGAVIGWLVELAVAIVIVRRVAARAHEAGAVRPE